MEAPLRTSTDTVMLTDQNSRDLSYGNSTKYLEKSYDVMIECVEMREETSNSFTALLQGDNNKSTCNPEIKKIR